MQGRPKHRKGPKRDRKGRSNILFTEKEANSRRWSIDYKAAAGRKLLGDRSIIFSKFYGMIVCFSDN